DSDGNWHIQLSDGTRLLGTQGNWTFRVTATDEAGNSATSDSFKVNYVGSNKDDISAPDAPTIIDYTDNVGTSTGNLASGTVTDDTTPTLNGHAEAGSLVKVYEGTTLLGSITANSNGDWHITPPPRSEGNHTFTATATDASGNVSLGSAGFVVKIDVPATDTTPPAPPVITGVYDDVGSHTGNVANGGKTDDVQVGVSGTAEANSSVVVWLRSPVGKDFNLGTVTADSSGHWSYQMHDRQSFGDMRGDWTFSATATDAAGNTSQFSAGYTVESVGSNQDSDKDITPPAPPVITTIYDDVGVKTGNVDNGGKTDDAQVKVSGTAEANSAVVVWVRSPAGKDYDLGTVTTDSNGHWHYQMHDSQNIGNLKGNWIFSATATDAAGNTSQFSAGYVVESVGSNQDSDKDVTPPATPHITNAYDDVGTKGNITSGGTTDDTRPTLSGTAEAGSLVKIYDNNTFIGTATANSSGNWSWTTPTRSEGQHTFRVTATDAAGNTSGKSVGYVVNVDIPDPGPGQAHITSVYDDVGPSTGNVINGGTTDDTTVTLTGTATAGSMVYVYADTKGFDTVYANSQGVWTSTVTPRTDGQHVFTAREVKNGVTGEESNSWVVNVNTADVTPPATPHITNAYDDVGTKGNITSGGTTDDTTPKLSGTAEAGSKVTIYDNNTFIGTATANSSGNWSWTTPIRSEGQHTFRVTATDAAGNTSGKSVGYVVNVDIPDPGPGQAHITSVYDDVGPSTGNVINGGTTDDTTVTLTGTATAGSMVYVYADTKGFDTVYANSQGVWTSTVTPRTDGQHVFTAREVKNGVTGEESNSWVVNVNTADVTPPATPHITNAYDDVGTKGNITSGGTTDDTTPTLSGTAEAGSKVTIYDNNTFIGTATANSSGNWSWTTPIRSEGQHTFRVTATDAAGNTSGKSGGYVVNVDVPNPVVKHIESFEGTEIPSHFYNLTTKTGVHITSSAGLYLLNTPGVLVDSVNGTHVLGGGNANREQAISVSLPGTSETVFVNLQTQNISGARFYDANGLQIHATVIDTGRAGGDLQLHRYEFTADAGHSISSFTVSASYIDTIEWHNSSSYSAMINHQNPLSQTIVQTDDEQASSASTEIMNHPNQDVLHLTLNDILSEAHDNLFIQDGHKQLAVTGDAGDVVELKVEDLAHNTWQDAGQVTAGGVQYEVYQHAGSNVELLVQHGLELHQVS
ncbi:Ig-like domain-containing protein, partial [Scandinavium sp. M-37]|uniref:Ig-like domain-containing protein n=1 Tax=Scandinavium sp. M-37 TaxID=3373077 RepID=UPI0037476DA6